MNKFSTFYKVLKSALKCHLCNTVIESKHRYDFVSCNCSPPNQISLDGGRDIYRRILANHNNYSDLSEVIPFCLDDINNYIQQLNVNLKKNSTTSLGDYYSKQLELAVEYKATLLSEKLSQKLPFKKNKI